MSLKNHPLITIVAAGLMLCCLSPTRSMSAVGPKSTPATPCMDALYRFNAPNVPRLGPAETEVSPTRLMTNPPPTPGNLPGKGLAQHPMLYAGEGYNKMFVINNGKIIWTYSTGKGNEYDDIWMLSNGNILFSRMQYVAEVTPEKKVVWRYDAATNTEIHCCQPIGLDKVLFIANGLPFLQPPDPKTVHPQFRRVRYTAQGTYLCPFLNMHKVIEYDKDFKEVWSFGEDDLPAGTKFSPWAAIRLKNGNTLITNESGKSQLEVSPDKKIVWSLVPDDLPEEYRYANTQTCTRLANGNTIVCSRGGAGKPQLVEVTPDEKVVWVLEDYANLGPATAVQILDDPGIPENPGESLH
jgi:hypothetical protein